MNHIFGQQTFSNLRKVLLPALLVCIVILYFGTKSGSTNQEPTLFIQKNNPIVVENLKQGTKGWKLTNPATNQEIEGYASLTSVNRGGEIKLFVNTKEPNYTIEIFRMGWYGGAGARQIIPPITRGGIAQPPPIVDEDTGLIECNWQSPYVLKIRGNSNDSTDWISGFYLAKLTASQSGKQSYIIFVVRDDRRRSDILFQSSVTTYQAYNNWGGMSLYRWNSRGMQARKVSFNRPYAASPNRAATYGVGAGEFLTNFQPPRRTSSAGWEYNMVRWLEKEGYDVSYATDVDTHENLLDVYSGQPMLLMHKAFLAVGHDEYWSWEMRRNLELARDAGVSLGFFAANTGYWQIRFEPSLITRDVNRTIVSYKESAALDPFARDNNPTNDYLVTTLWRNPPVNRPEDALIGVMYETFPVNADIFVDDTAPDWLLSGTQLDKNQTAASGKQLRLMGLLGYEVDRMFGNAPADTIRLAHSPYAYNNRTRYSDMTVYTAASGAMVFATGSIQWSWGLDDYNSPQLRPSVLSSDAQAITRNVMTKLLIAHS
ncbi:MAG: N,N-dimethylformamidase beta subunit family domain-containing protein [Nostocaceae cyanobacterium]|nr:N,N-dimethylformamidase beta subunit family domain-containing protein [Nostocaceae cyanobacterium]